MNCTYNERTNRYRVEDAFIKYPNFEGVESGSVNKAGKKNFKLVIDEELAAELEDQGIIVKEERRRDDSDPQMYSVKIGVYPESKVHMIEDDIDIDLRKKDPDTQEVIDRSGVIDQEFRNGYVRNGEIDVKFHISKNRLMTPPVPYLRLDSIYVPVDQDEQAAKYANFQKG